MDAESYADPELSKWIQEKFIPNKVHIKENAAGFHRMDVLWTPTALVLDENGKERLRIEGYLPKDEFAAQLTLGLARVSFMHKKWADAGKLYDEILEKYPNSAAAPEAVYWKAVCHYKATNDHTVLGEVPKILQEKYPMSVWAKKALPWVA
ncbi:MAG TPA: tetratricopeptide repeat protein [Candidatus Angelobacter sp.]|nr:tetratricopeptide repeat protein [Candidatus Angelobacter sp.]